MNNYSTYKLDNGLNLVLVPNESTEVLTSIILFKVGSRNETNENAGISHVLEHMVFKGSKKRPAAIDVSEFADSLGAEYNAFTGKEYTGYYIKLRPKNLEKGFDYLSDLILDPLFKESDLTREKEVIVQEINMYQDLPMEMVGVYFERAVFGENALGREIIGYKDTVRAVNQKKLFEYKDSHYQAENAVLVLAGNLGQSEEKVKELAQKYFKLSGKPVAKMEPVKVSRRKPNYFVQNKETEQSHLIVGFETVPLNHPDYFKLELLGTILGGSMSSRMFTEVREKRGLAYAVKTFNTNFQESGTIYTQAGVEHDKLNEALSAIMDVYRKIKTEKVSPEELQKAKEVISGKLLIKLEDSEELASHYAYESLFAKKIMTPDQIVSTYQKITEDDILEVANKYLTNDRIAASFVGPTINKEEIRKLLKI